VSRETLPGVLVLALMVVSVLVLVGLRCGIGPFAPLSQTSTPVVATTTARPASATSTPDAHVATFTATPVPTATASIVATPRPYLEIAPQRHERPGERDGSRYL
jgi:outer membrane receptor protein involved in Fe transport